MTTTNGTEMVTTGASQVPRWLWDQLQGYGPDVLTGYFSGRNLEVYYEGPDADASYLEQVVGTTSWSRAITAWAAVQTHRGEVVGVRAGGPVTEDLAGVLDAEVQVDSAAVIRARDEPGPAVVRVAVWDVDWWEPAFGLKPVIEYEPAPTVERVHRAAALARALGARSMVAGTIYGNDAEVGAALSLSVEGLVVEDTGGHVAGQVSEVLGRGPDTIPRMAWLFLPDEAVSDSMVCWSWA